MDFYLFGETTECIRFVQFFSISPRPLMFKNYHRQPCSFNLFAYHQISPYATTYISIESSVEQGRASTL
jgi:hypothetical protein